MNEKPELLEMSSVQMINVQQYERYLPSAFDNSLTMLEKINKMIHNLNTLGGISDELVKQWNEMLKWIVGSGLTDTVEKIINDKIANGDFDNIFDSLIGNLADLTTIDKTNIVAAVNEINAIATKARDDIGDITQINSPHKGNLVEVINVMLNDIIINRQAPITIGEATGFGVISGFLPRQQSVLSMALEVGNSTIPNIIHMRNGVRYVMPSQTIAIEDADTVLNRIDMVYVNDSGFIEVRKGVNAVEPLKPHYNTYEVPIAYVTVTANDTTINNSDIEDGRPLKDLSSLKTKHKENLVLAINEVFEMIGELKTFIEQKVFSLIGDMDDLPTDDKTTIVASIVEIWSKMAFKTDVDLTIGDLTTLTTKDKDSIVEAINSVVSEMGSLVGLNTTDKTTLVNAINEVLTKTVSNDTLGDLSLLLTKDKSSIVGAINSLVEDDKEIMSIIGKLSDLGTGTTLINEINVNKNNINAMKISLDQREYNIMDYGGVKDGVTDNGPKINALVDIVVANGGGTIYFPSGNYAIATTIKKKRFVNFRGSGSSTTYLTWNAPNNGVIMDSSNEALWNSFVSGIRFQKQTAFQVTGFLGGSTIQLYNSAICKFEDLAFVGLYAGIRGNAEVDGVGIFDSLFENLFFDSCEYGLWLHGSGNTIINPRVVLCKQGFRYDFLNPESFASAITIGGVFIQNNYDISIPDKRGIRPSSFHGTWFEQSDGGIVAIANLDTQVMSLGFVGCMLNSNTNFELMSFWGAIGAITVDTCTIAQSYRGPYKIIGPANTERGKLQIRNCNTLMQTGASVLTDNTHIDVTPTPPKRDRSHATYSMVDSQTLQANIRDSVLFNKIDFQYGIQHQGAGKFKVDNVGFYNITVAVQLNEQPPSRVELYLAENGIVKYKLANVTSYGNSLPYVTGSLDLNLNPANGYDIMILSTVNGSVIVSPASTYLKIVELGDKV